MKYLYHVSFDAKPGLHHFIPRIPDVDHTEYEDTSIPRICFSDSILKCISALSPANRNMREGALIAIYKMPFPISDFVTPKELYEKHLVYDALEHNEYWYLEPIDLVGTVYCIINFNYEHAIGFTTIERYKFLQILRTHVPSHAVIDERIGDNKSLYESVTKQLWNDEYFTEIDAIDDALAELHYAQRIEIFSLTLQDIDTGEIISLPEASMNQPKRMLLLE